MGLASIFESFNIVCNCFFPNKKDKTYEYKDIQKSMDDTELDITIIPATTSFNLKNLYPRTNKVDKWSLLLIGGDLTYIKVCIGDTKLPFINNKVVNNRGDGVLPPQLHKILDPIWRKTLVGHNLQFFLSVNQILYFINTFPLHNDDKTIIGALMVIRPFTSELRETLDIPFRSSMELSTSE